MKRSRVATALCVAVALLLSGATSGAIAGGSSCAVGVAGAGVAGKAARNDPAMTEICQKACATKIAYKETDIVAQPGAKRGDLTRCPVSGVVFKVGFTNPTVAYKGKDYRFCCPMCSKEFKAKPTRFVS